MDEWGMAAENEYIYDDGTQDDRFGELTTVPKSQRLPQQTYCPDCKRSLWTTPRGLFCDMCENYFPKS